MKPLHAAVLTSSLLLIAGCSSTGVIPVGDGVYYISKTSAAGAFTDMTKLKAGVIRQADEFAKSQGKSAIMVDMHDTFPAHGFPTVDYKFRLVDNATNSVTK